MVLKCRMKPIPPQHQPSSVHPIRATSTLLHFERLRKMTMRQVISKESFISVKCQSRPQHFFLQSKVDVQGTGFSAYSIFLSVNTCEVTRLYSSRGWSIRSFMDLFLPSQPPPSPNRLPTESCEDFTFIVQLCMQLLLS